MFWSLLFGVNNKRVVKLDGVGWEGSSGGYLIVCLKL